MPTQVTRTLLPLLVALAIFPAACERSPTTPPAATTAASSGNGVIRSRIVLQGIAPTMRIIPGSPQVKDETIVVGSGGGLKNVIVYLENAPPASPPTQAPAALDQINCVYVPHVLAVQAGQTLRLKSSDPVLHNVLLQCSLNPPANYGFPTIGERAITLKLPEPPFNVRCDVHPWMSAWIGVFAHRWFAVTADDGSFSITHVPPGNYTLAAWHEALPLQRQNVTVSEASATVVRFTFPAP